MCWWAHKHRALEAAGKAQTSLREKQMSFIFSLTSKFPTRWLLELSACWSCPRGAAAIWAPPELGWATGFLWGQLNKAQLLGFHSRSQQSSCVWAMVGQEETSESSRSTESISWELRDEGEHPTSFYSRSSLCSQLGQSKQHSLLEAATAKVRVLRPGKGWKSGGEDKTQLRTPSGVWGMRMCSSSTADPVCGLHPSLTRDAALMRVRSSAGRGAKGVWNFPLSMPDPQQFLYISVSF